MSVISETRGFAATRLLPPQRDHDQQLRRKVDSLLNVHFEKMSIEALVLVTQRHRNLSDFIGY